MCFWGWARRSPSGKLQCRTAHSTPLTLARNPSRSVCFHTFEFSAENFVASRGQVVVSWGTQVSSWYSIWTFALCRSLSQNKPCSKPSQIKLAHSRDFQSLHLWICKSHRVFSQPSQTESASRRLASWESSTARQSPPKNCAIESLPCSRPLLLCLQRQTRDPKQLNLISKLPTTATLACKCKQAAQAL